MRSTNYLCQIGKSLSLISDQIGLFPYIGKAALLNSDPKIVGYTAFNCNTKLLGGGMYSGRSGGCGFNWEDSILATIGEGVERYSIAFFNKEKMQKKKFRDFSYGEAVNPSKFALFHEEQYQQKAFPFVKLGYDTVLYWDRVYDMISKKSRYCPSAFLYMPFKEDEVRVSDQISTGLAAHSNYLKAILNATYEVIERDAFMISWMNLLDVPKIRIEGSLKKFVEGNLPNHFELHLFDMTTDIKVPSVFGILKGEHDFGEFTAFSAATRFNIGDAVRKTVLELCQSVPYHRFLLIEHDNLEFDDFNMIRTFEHHSVLYTKRKKLCSTFELWLHKEPDKTIDFEETDTKSDFEKLRYIKNQFLVNDCSFLVKDVTTQDVSRANFCVIRVVCPELIHITGTYGNYHLGGNRLYEVPEKMGFQTRTYSQLNPFPHPFP